MKMTVLPFITQTELSRALKTRIENPKDFIGRPLIVWRSYVGDGIQRRILEDVFKQYNADRSLHSRKQYELGRMIHGTLMSVTGCLDEAESSVSGHCEPGLIAVDPFFIYKDFEENPKSINRYRSLLEGHLFEADELRSQLPVVAYMSCPEEASRYLEGSYPNAEQFIFRPDFEEWSNWSIVSDVCPQYLIDFIRGNGDIEGITYRWYNLYNQGTDLSKFYGCMFPAKWQTIFGKWPKKTDFTDDDIAAIYRKDGISKDIKNSLIDFIKERQEL